MWVNEFENAWHRLYTELTYWALVFGLLAFVRLVERRDLASIGFPSLTWADALAGIVTAILALIGLALLYFVIFPALHVGESEQIERITPAPIGWQIASVMRAGVSEEVLFRKRSDEQMRHLAIPAESRKVLGSDNALRVQALDVEVLGGLHTTYCSHWWLHRQPDTPQTRAESGSVRHGA